MYRDLEIPIHELVVRTLPCRINGTLGTAYLFHSVLVLEVSSSLSPLSLLPLSALFPGLCTPQERLREARPGQRHIRDRDRKDSTPATARLHTRCRKSKYQKDSMCRKTDKERHCIPCIPCSAARPLRVAVAANALPLQTSRLYAARAWVRRLLTWHHWE